MILIATLCLFLGPSPRLTTVRQEGLPEASALYAAGELERARDAFHDCGERAEESGDARTLALSRAYLGAIARRLDQPDEARRQLELAAETIGAFGSVREQYFVLDELGEALLAARANEAAFEVYERFARLAEADRANASMAWTGMARAHEALEEFDEAWREHELAMDLGAESKDVARECRARYHAALFRQHRADHEWAQELYERVLEVGPASGVGLETHGQLSDLHLAQGRYAQARSHLAHCRELAQASTDRRQRINVRTKAANLAFFTGDLARAGRTLEEILGEEALSPRDGFLATINLAVVREHEGDLAEAARLLTAARASLGESSRPDDRWLALYTHARVRRECGESEAAHTDLEQALELAREQEDASAEGQTLNSLAYLALLEGDPEVAIEQGRRAATLLERIGEREPALHALHTVAAAELARGRTGAVEDLLERANELLGRQKNSASDRWERAGVRSLFARWGEVAHDLVALRSRSGEPSEKQLLEGLRGAGEWKARTMLEGLRLRDPLSTREDAVGRVRTLLPEGTVLVDYAAGAEKLYAYVVDRERIAFVELGARDELESLAAEYVAGLSGEDHRPLAELHEVARLGGELHARLVGPLVERFAEKIEVLVVVPTPGLASLPFEALVVSAPAGAATFQDLVFVADRYQVTYAPSLPVLAWLEQVGPRAQEGRALLMGDPVYARELADARGSRNTGAGGYWRLLATKDEVVEIAEMFLLQAPEESPRLAELGRERRSRSGAFSTPSFDLFFGQRASIDELRRAPETYSVLHLAAHGQVDPSDPRRTGVVLSFEPESGGLLALADILELTLDANLVVVSACSSARGRVLRGEGIQSLAQAFLEAGARAVVASLWDVHDRETSATMKGFYESYLLDGEPAAAALHRAKLELRRHRDRRGVPLDETTGRVASGHPHFWAPFIHSGALP